MKYSKEVTNPNGEKETVIFEGTEKETLTIIKTIRIIFYSVLLVVLVVVYKDPTIIKNLVDHFIN